MSRRMIKRGIAIILIVSLLLGTDGNAKLVKAASMNRENAFVSATENQPQAKGEKQEISSEDSLQGNGELNDTMPQSFQVEDDRLDTEDLSEVANEEESVQEALEVQTEELTADSNVDAVDDGIEVDSDEEVFTRVYSLKDDKFETETNTTPLPTHVTSSTQLTEGILYQITTNEQWNTLSVLSQTSNLSGYRFCYQKPVVDGSTKDYYDLAGFAGIGTENTPFAGELFSNYTIDNIAININKPLFNYLSTQAKIYNIKLNVSNSCAGLAEYLKVEETNQTETNIIASYSYINISGTVKNENNAGGMFAHVLNDTNKKLILQGNQVSVSASVQGGTAGGLIGELTGSTELCLGGFISLPTKTTGFDNKSGEAVGGLIGYIHGTANSKITIELSSTSNSVSLKNDEKFPYNSKINYCGGYFGLIEYADIDVNCSLSFSGTADPDIRGYDIGTFAGRVNNSTITLNQPFECTYARLKIAQNSTDGLQHGAGMFIGVLNNSTVNVGDNFPSGNLPAIIIKEGFFHDISTDYNFGGIIGYAYNSNLNFTKEHPCKINKLSINSCKGNIAGIIGMFEVLNNNYSIHYAQVDYNNDSSNDITLNSQGGNVGGLVGIVKMSNGDVTISNCMFTGLMKLYIDDPDGSVSTCVARAEYGDTKSGKIVLENVGCWNNMIAAGNGKRQFYSYGGAIGTADADFEISGDNNNFIHTGDPLAVNIGNIGTKCEYYGGLIGSVKNTSGAVRKGTVKNVLVGRCKIKDIRQAYGGLFGEVASKTAISLDENIKTIQNKSDTKDKETTQTAYFRTSTDIPVYLGSIAGQVDNALIYMEPNCQPLLSEVYTSDEIGNYGGVIRNGYWDKPQSENGELLIKDYAVQGTLTTDINTVGDLLRFAIAMNTEGVFLPQKDGNSLNTIDDIKKAQYHLTVAEYDLTNTGLMCLARNDEHGMTHFPFQGSLIGKANGQSKIIYHINSHGQQNIGLFPLIVADESAAEFKNLNLEYTIKYENSKAFDANTNYSPIEKSPETEHAGGLAAKVSGNISVDNISYTGTMSDVDNVKYNDELKEYVEKQDDYLGGIFGEYAAKNDTTLSMNHVTANMTVSYNDSTHVMGGMIGYVNLDDVTDNCTIQIGSSLSSNDNAPIQLRGTYTVNAHTKTSSNAQVSPFVTIIGDKNKSGTDYRSICNLDIQGVDVNGVEQSVGDSAPVYSEIGGFLGCRWMDVEANVKNIEIGTTNKANISAKAAFGGLVHTVCGKMVLENVSIGNQTSFDTKGQPEVDNCALLVRDGQYLYMNVTNYTVADNIVLSNYAGSYFDEVVGFTKGGDDEKHGGIVSLNNSNGTQYYLGRGVDYKSYLSDHVVDENGAIITKPNPKTRYYYDLNKLEWNGGSNTTAASEVIQTSDDVMKWHVLHYANESIRKCIDSNYTSLPTSYDIQGTTDNHIIDMSGYSIYPTPVRNETYHSTTNVKIIFKAQEIISGENTQMSSHTKNEEKYPEDGTRQHYQMQAGLFGDVSGITVNGLTLSGNYSKSCPDAGSSMAGALIAGSIYGIANGKDSNGKTTYDTAIKNTFTNITLDNLWCVDRNEQINYNAENVNLPIGLMIADISSGAQVSLDGISMMGYSNDAVTAVKKAASALIGNVGGEKATYISLSFKNMDLADAAEGKNNADLKSSKADEALAKASFIYSYDYEENCNGIYTFDYEDYLEGRCKAVVDSSGIFSGTNGKKVTLGLELGVNENNASYAKEEYFNKDMFVGQMVSGDTGITFACDNYLPYVFKTKKILVNPKAGNLDVGCGTYEDPYIISSTKQLITLYRYLYDEEKFEDILKFGQWKVNITGNDGKICNKQDENPDGHSCVAYKEDGFPNKGRLSMAYYKITADLDLSEYPEFVGFGRADDMPFIGVFVGEKKSDNKYPTIIMSKVSTTNSVENYGFIQVAKGCVVKDVVLQYNEPIIINRVVKEDPENPVDEGGSAGGVIATVLGGENVIDNVTVTGCPIENSEAVVECFQPKNTKAMIGGYVGAVNAGGVILRNVNNSSLSGFNVRLSSKEGSAPISDYLYCCGIIGRVYDGYVVYDGEDGSNKPLFMDLAGKYQNNRAEISPNGQSRSYDIVNGAYLKSNSGDTAKNKIIWNKDSKSYEIADAKQLQVISMALNAGMLNLENNESMYVGYNLKSRQRSGNYDYVGNVDAGSTTSASYQAREYVIKYDNLLGASTMAYRSYLSQYFAEWNETDVAVSVANDGEYSGNAILNPFEDIVTYNLTGNDYDMSVFKTAFRGLGARYYEDGIDYDNPTSTDFKHNVFHGNLVGPDTNGAKITLYMLVDGIQDVNNVALLNNLRRPKNNEQMLEIKNIILAGDVENKSDVGATFSEYVGSNNAAGIISTLQNVTLTIENVTLDKLHVKSQNYAAGMMAYSTGCSITFKNCGITGQSDTSNGTAEQSTNKTTILGRNITGGFVGFTNSVVNINKISNLQNLTVESIAKKDVLDDNNNKTGEISAGENAGGLIGTAENSFTIDGNGSVSETTTQPLIGTDITVRTSGDEIDVQVGGLVGSACITGKNYKFHDITLTNITVENTFSDTIKKHERGTIIGTGGIVGAVNGTAEMTNIVVGSFNREEQVVVQNTHESVPNHSSYGVGGLVGRHMSGNLTVKNSKVLGVKDTNNEYTTKIRSKGCGVAGVTGNCGAFTGENIIIDGVSINSAGNVGGIASWCESNMQCNLTKVEVKNVDINLISKGSAGWTAGYVGGLIGYGDKASTINVTSSAVDNIMVNSDVCNSAGGFFGKLNICKLNISTIDNENRNTISNCFLTGTNIGGVIGDKDSDGSYPLIGSGITISNNKLIADKDGAVGGFAGDLVVNNASDYICVEDLEIKNNLIAAYGSNPLSTLGGVCGKNRLESYFYHVTLEDNYIGRMLKSDTLTKASLLTTPIDSLRENLYYATATEASTLGYAVDEKINDTTVVKNDFYKYSYLQGAVFGSVASDASSSSNGYGIPKLIDVHIKYTESQYRPVSDVGNNEQKVTSNEEMYNYVRKRCAIVYDGRVGEEPIPKVTDLFGIQGYEDVPYVFGNIKSIMDSYTSSDSDPRMAYRLESNYQGGNDIALNVEDVYKNTFYDNDKYCSPYNLSGQPLPMVVYNSIEHGTLDQVLQTYINILTNNSGALNSYMNYTKTYISNILSVSAFQAKIENGVLSIVENNANPSVSVACTNGKYIFSSETGDEYTDSQNGTFSIVQVTYGWNRSSTTREKMWTLFIPVYVEKRLQIHSNMKMLEGIQYDTTKLKNTGLFVKSEDTDPSDTILTRGNSFSIYTEYIYGDSDKFTNITIPKTFYIEANGEVYFLKGTKITMIPIDEKSKAYYYEVTENEEQIQEISFTQFKDADNKPYQLKNVKSQVLSSYTDIHDVERNNVLVERYVLLVDTSKVTEARNNATYKMHIQPKELWEKDPSTNNDKYPIGARTDYHEHSYEKVNEIDGATCKINQQMEGTSKTYLESGSQISKDGSVKVHLEYDITANDLYWTNVNKTKDYMYMDVGFYFTDDNTKQKITLPQGTQISLCKINVNSAGEKEETIVTIPANQGQAITYFYQSLSRDESVNLQEETKLSKNASKQIEITFDFSQVEDAALEQYSDKSLSIVAELVVTKDINLPAGGDVKDSWSKPVTAEAKKDIGFALDVDDMTTLGMNQYSPEASDSGVVPYTVSIAFPDNVDNLAAKDYKIVYEIEKKTSKDSNGKPTYETYDGENISLYLGKFDNNAAAKEAFKSGTSTVNSGRGITSVTYHFDSTAINTIKSNGMVLQDGSSSFTDATNKVKGVLKTNCTLVANCDGLDMTNYRVKAYLIVSDHNEATNTGAGYLMNCTIRNGSWSEAGIDDKINQKNDFFVFTVAKLKTSMQ